MIDAARFRPGWRKSSFSASGNCVEIANDHDGSVLVRDSKYPTEKILSFSASTWHDFIGALDRNSVS
jgi:hypothetical protein